MLMLVQVDSLVICQRPCESYTPQRWETCNNKEKLRVQRNWNSYKFYAKVKPAAEAQQQMHAPRHGVTSGCGDQKSWTIVNKKLYLNHIPLRPETISSTVKL